MGRTSSTSPGMEDDDPPAGGGGGGGVYDNNNCKMPGVGFISSLADEQEPSGPAAAVVNRLASSLSSSTTTTRLNNNNNKLSAETSCFFNDGKVEIRRLPIVLRGDSNHYVSSSSSSTTTTAMDLNLKQCVSGDADCHLSRCVVTRSNSTTAIIISRHGETRQEEEVVVVVEEKKKDAAADSNNNNDHAPPPDHHHGGGGGGGGGERRRRSAVEILRRSLVSVAKSPSLNLNNNNRLQQQQQRQRNGSNADGNSNDRGPNRARSDVRIHAGGDRQRDECGDCEKKKKKTTTTKSRPEEVTAAAEEEEAGPGLTPAPSESHRVDSSPECFRNDGTSTAASSSTAPDGSPREHVYCTVYCIVDDAEVAKMAADPLGRRSVLVADGGRGREEVEEEEEEEYTTTTTGGGGGSMPEPYTLADLVDPLSGEEGGVGLAVRSCRVCLDDKAISPLHCCRKAVCGECLKLYVSSQVRVGRAYITCPIPECFGLLEEGLVVSHLANEEVGKYRYFLELSRLDASTKPCPHCSLFTSLTPHTPPSTKETKYKVRCSACQFVWCFKCHAPWHDGLKCRDYRRGDKLLRHWASVVEHGQRNAQKCPQCKIHIQRTEGCDHMTCTQCNTNFCYRCGERYRHLRFFGDHTSNLSVFGCKYRYLPDKPHLRRLVRGSVCVSKLVIAPVVIVLVVVLGALSLVIGLLVFPVYYVCKRRRKQQQSQGSGRWI